MARFGRAPADRHDVATEVVDTPAPVSAFSLRGRFGSPISMPSSAFLAGTPPANRRRPPRGRARVAAPQRSG